MYEYREAFACQPIGKRVTRHTDGQASSLMVLLMYYRGLCYILQQYVTHSAALWCLLDCLIDAYVNTMTPHSTSNSLVQQNGLQQNIFTCN